MQIGKWYFRDGGYTSPGVCKECGSRWPAMTTIEAFNNHERAGAIHAGQPCSMNEAEQCK